MCSNLFHGVERRDIDLSEDDEDALEEMIHCESIIEFPLHPSKPEPWLDFYHSDCVEGESQLQASSASKPRRLAKKLDSSHMQDPLLSPGGNPAPSGPVLPVPNDQPDASSPSTSTKKKGGGA